MTMTTIRMMMRIMMMMMTTTTTTTTTTTMMMMMLYAVCDYARIWWVSWSCLSYDCDEYDVIWCLCSWFAMPPDAALWSSKGAGLWRRSTAFAGVNSRGFWHQLVLAISGWGRSLSEGHNWGVPKSWGYPFPPEWMVFLGKNPHLEME